MLLLNLLSHVNQALLHLSHVEIANCRLIFHAYLFFFIPRSVSLDVIMKKKNIWTERNLNPLHASLPSLPAAHITLIGSGWRPLRHVSLMYSNR